MKTAIILASLILALSGCANMSEQQKSTAIGAGVGAAVVGGATGSWVQQQPAASWVEL